MEPIRTPRNKKLIVILTAAAIIIAAITGTILFNHLQADMKQSESKPLFTFDEQKAPGWWAADNWHGSDDPQASDASIITGRNFATGTKEQPGSCFAMYFLKKGSVDAASELKTLVESRADKDSGGPMELIDTKTISMQTPEGSKTLEMHRYNLVNGEAAQLASGVAYGYVALNESYIEVQNHCETPEQLTATPVIFEAVQLKK